MGAVLRAAFRFPVNYTSTLAMAFMLAGPFLVIGLYELPRQREVGAPKDFRRSLVAWCKNLGGIGVYVLILTVVFLVWARASLVTFALFESRGMPSREAFFDQLVSLQNVSFVVMFFGVGLAFAALVFVFSAVSIPVLPDRRADAVTVGAVSVSSMS